MKEVIKFGKKSNPEKVKIGELITSDRVLNAEMRMFHAKNGMVFDGWMVILSGHLEPLLIRI